MIFFAIPFVMLSWVLGGQINKIFKPIGVTLSLIVFFFIAHQRPWYCFLPSLLYGFWLAFGYGEDSKLMKWLKDDEKVRIVYSLICCIPPIFTIALTRNWYSYFSLIFILGAFQTRFPSLGKIGKYDILPDDILRGLSIGLSMSFSLI
jgi:hypothetical protein